MSKIKKIAVLGSGGREHAIAWKLAQDLGQDAIFVLPGNAAIPNSHDIDITDFDAIQSFCLIHDINWIFVGPEQALADGIVDFFQDTDIRVLGPDAASAKLESSKILSKDFMFRHGVATAPFIKFDAIKKGRQFIESLNDSFVIKLDGLAGGKGVFVCDSQKEGLEALDLLKEKFGENISFLIEDKIIGDEISIIGFTDGHHIQLLQPSQDHKQLLDGDNGPNTGGMGAYCPVPFWNKNLADDIQQQIIQPTLKGIQSEAMNYRGIIYFGIMISAEGPFLLEYNVRLGDPETEVLLPSLKSSLVDLMEATLTGQLDKINLEFEEGYFVDVVLASGGYPATYPTGLPIDIQPMPSDTLLFYAGVSKENNHLVTSGGRVINLVAHGDTLAQAIKKAYANINNISFDQKYFRKDIGLRKNEFLKNYS